MAPCAVSVDRISSPRLPKTRRPIATISHPVRAKIYRGRFRPFESTRYLDLQALRKVAKTTIEIGAIEAPGLSATLVAEIKKGMITRLRPMGCVGCKPRKASKARLKRVLAAVTDRLEPLLDSPPMLPMRLTLNRTDGIVIGPIVIVVDEGIPCVWIWIGQLVCIICEFGWTCLPPP